jgi:opacity protein-like surface antigen
MKTILLLITGLAGAALHAGAPPAAMETKGDSAWTYSLSFDTGWREDHFEWSIAGDLNGRNPNILSELDWRHLNIVATGAQVEITFRRDWHFDLGGSYGWIVSGANRDSDYNFSNHRGEFSRSVADALGDKVDADAIFGYDFRLSSHFTLTAQLGFTYHRLRVNDTSGVQLVNTEFHEVGPFAGLNSTYDANWWGPEFGLQAKLQLAEKWRWLAGARYELLRYHGHANWNLRPDFINFHDTASGTGWMLTTGVEWDFARHWTLAVLGDYGYRRACAGTDDTELTNHTHELTQFNGATWESVGVRAIATYRF